ncbi:hypothetical protein A2U01_0073706, partial [Trifolium medium]|nr:hypothetical protein [Trifolium medium]
SRGAMASSNAWFGSFESCWLLRAAPMGAALRVRLCLEGTYCLCLLRAAPGSLRHAQGALVRVDFC